MTSQFEWNGTVPFNIQLLYITIHLSILHSNFSVYIQPPSGGVGQCLCPTWHLVCHIWWPSMSTPASPAQCCLDSVCWWTQSRPLVGCVQDCTGHGENILLSCDNQGVRVGKSTRFCWRIDWKIYDRITLGLFGNPAFTLAKVMVPCKCRWTWSVQGNLIRYYLSWWGFCHQAKHVNHYTTWPWYNTIVQSTYFHPPWLDLGNSCWSEWVQSHSLLNYMLQCSAAISARNP